MRSIDPSAGPGGSLVILIPCLNEEKTLAEVIEGIPAKIPGVARIIPLVVDDGSTDGTERVARECGAEVVRHRENLGLGRTFRDGIDRSLELGADVVVNIDGDGQFNPRHIPLLVEPILCGSAEMVTASRFKRKDLTPDMPKMKYLGNKIVAHLVWVLSGKKFADVSCGFRAFSRHALLNMNLYGDFTYTQETFLQLAYKGLAIIEIPLKVRGQREHGSSRVASSLVRYAYRSLQTMLRVFIAYRPFTFFVSISAVISAIGFGFLLFLVFHYLRTGRFSPHIWAGFVGGGFGFVGILVLVIGFLADLMIRIRSNQEKILYYLRYDDLARNVVKKPMKRKYSNKGDE